MMTIELSPAETWIDAADIRLLCGGISQRTLWDWTTNQGLRAVKNRCSLRVRLDHLVKWAAQHKPKLRLPRSEGELMARLDELRGVKVSQPKVKPYQNQNA